MHLLVNLLQVVRIPHAMRTIHGSWRRLLQLNVVTECEVEAVTRACGIQWTVPYTVITGRPARPQPQHYRGMPAADTQHKVEHRSCSRRTVVCRPMGTWSTGPRLLDPIQNGDADLFDRFRSVRGLAGPRWRSSARSDTATDGRLAPGDTAYALDWRGFTIVRLANRDHVIVPLEDFIRSLTSECTKWRITVNCRDSDGHSS